MTDGEVKIESLQIPEGVPTVLQTGSPDRQSGMKFLLQNLVQCEVAVSLLKRKFVTRDELDALIVRIEALEKDISRINQWTAIPGRNDN
jgi:hypothetical protein